MLIMAKVPPNYAGQGFEVQMYDTLMADLAHRNPRKFFVGIRDDKVLNSTICLNILRASTPRYPARRFFRVYVNPDSLHGINASGNKTNLRLVIEYFELTDQYN